MMKISKCQDGRKGIESGPLPLLCPFLVFDGRRWPFVEFAGGDRIAFS